MFANINFAVALIFVCYFVNKSVTLQTTHKSGEANSP